MKEFKIRCSQISKIMGPLKGGLTNSQLNRHDELFKRFQGEGKPLTDKMSYELLELRRKKEEPLKLPDTCTSYLKQWYSEQMYGDSEELDNKYVRKGNQQEDTAIDLVEEMTELFLLSKNEEYFENEWCTGTPDIITADMILDTKCSWNGKTFLEAVMSSLCDVYEWQMRGYMFLTGKEVAHVCYCLVDTPDDANYGVPVSYSEIPEEKRFHKKHVFRDESLENEIKNRVVLCREWLDEYDKQVKERLGI